MDKEVSRKQSDDSSIMHWFVCVEGLASFSYLKGKKLQGIRDRWREKWEQKTYARRETEVKMVRTSERVSGSHS